MLTKRFWLFLLCLVTNVTLGTPVCCTFENGDKIFSKEFNCRKANSQCCLDHEKDLLINRGMAIQVSAGHCDFDKPLDLVRNYLSEVKVCYASTHFSDTAPKPVGEIMDFTTEVLSLKHAWLKTPNKEAGQGPTQGTIVGTSWANHLGFETERNGTCLPVAKCNVQCVENQMNPGSDLGAYGRLNDCHDVVVRTLKACGCKDTCISYAKFPKVCRAWTFPPLGNSRPLLPLSFHLPKVKNGNEAKYPRLDRGKPDSSSH